MSAETLQFRTELKQILHIIVHSLYSHKDIFLRELISNASDAIDTSRFQSLTNPDLLEGDLDWKIRIIPDREKGTLTVSDMDGFLAWRNPGLRRATRSGVSQCLRSFLRYLYGAGFLVQDLAPHVPAPSQYRFENIPCAFGSDQVRRLLEVSRRDRRPTGLRDYAILLLIQTYGLRAGEVVRLRLRDIDWRRDQIHIQQSKTRADLWLPLMPEVGEALLDYLRYGRPKSHRWNCYGHLFL